MKVEVIQKPVEGTPATYVAHLEPGVTREYATADEAFEAHPLATLSRRPGKIGLDGKVRIDLTFAEARRLREFMRCTVLSHGSTEDNLLAALGTLEI